MAQIKCDMCGEVITGKTYTVVDENFNTQPGLVQCETCFAADLMIDEETEEDYE
jgi:ribosome-binding protein aMBF1 (putative translation factor)